MSDLSWRDGDVYFWRYREEPKDYTLEYWCRARKAIVKDGTLMDIYWACIDGQQVIFHNQGSLWTPVQANRHLLLDLKGNLDQFDVITDYNEPLYDVADILDLSHPNSPQKKLYLRKGATRSRVRMLEHCRYLREKAETAARHAKYNIDHFTEIEAKIEAGADLKEIYL